MAAHSSTLAWRILWMEEPGGLLSIGSYRVGHDWGDLACMHTLKKDMATHSSILAWRIPGMEDPGGLLSMGSHRVRHDWSDLAAAAHWVQFPELCSRFSLVIYFIHSIKSINIPISQFIPTLLSPLVISYFLTPQPHTCNNTEEIVITY